MKELIAQLEALLAVLKAQIGEASVSLAPWWRPTLDQAKAFAAKHAVAFESVLGIGSAQIKLPPVAPGDVAAAKEYAAFGYRPSGVHYLWTQEWISGQRDFADRVAACGSPQEAEALISGVSSVETEAVIYAIMTGMVEAPKFTPFRSPAWNIYVTDADGVGHAATNISEILTLLQYVPPLGGPGPGIG